MNKISFQLKFDTQVDLKNEFNSIEKFWDNFFIKNITTNLLHALDFSENWAKNSLEDKDMTKKKFNSYGFAEFRETAKNTTQEIRDSIVYEVVSTNGSIQDINVSFSINYNVPEKAKYCASIDDYLNDAIIDNLVYQSEKMKEFAQIINNKESARVTRIDEHFLELLNQMKDTLKIESPKITMKM
jgi:predicted house-cleaning noncanonical NTP pyrophosphatase (MazG superfamily)